MIDNLKLTASNQCLDCYLDELSFHKTVYYMFDSYLNIPTTFYNIHILLYLRIIVIPTEES